MMTNEEIVNHQQTDQVKTEVLDLVKRFMDQMNDSSIKTGMAKSPSADFLFKLRVVNFLWIQFYTPMAKAVENTEV